MTEAAILFVDDDAKLLKGLRRMLRGESKRWDMRFAESGEEALDQLRQRPADVVVSDIRMPGMDGIELMERVLEQHPDTVRIAMSGFSSADLSSLSALTVHRFLSKPCGREDLVRVIEDSLQRQSLVEDNTLRRMIATVHRLSSVPGTVRRLNEVLEREDSVSLSEVGAVIAEDVAMSAKIMHLVNSPFFGFARHIESPEQAVSLLGLDVVRSLALSFHLFAEFDAAGTPGFTLDYLWQHSLRVSRIAKEIAREIGCPREDMDHAFIAGLLHDVGKVVLATRFPERFNTALDSVRAGGLLLYEAERQEFGCGHDRVGGYLMGLWGLPEAELAAIAHHHDPAEAEGSPLVVAAVHMANVFDHRLVTFSGRALVPLVDGAFVAAHVDPGILPRLWERAQEIVEETDAGA